MIYYPGMICAPSIAWFRDMARAGARGHTRPLPGPWTEHFERWNFP